MEKTFITCTGLINRNGWCDKCGQPSQTTSNQCGRLMELYQYPSPEANQEGENKPDIDKMIDKGMEDLYPFDTRTARYIWKDYVEPLQSELKQAYEVADAFQQENKTLRQQLGLDNAWPLSDVLLKLVEASDILLGKHSYDGAGYEEIEICIKRAKEIANALKNNKSD